MVVVSLHKVYLIPSSDYTTLKPPTRGAVFTYMTCSIVIESLVIILSSNYRTDWLDGVTNYRTFHQEEPPFNISSLRTMVGYENT